MFHNGEFTARREESESGVEKGGARAPDFEFRAFSLHYPNGIDILGCNAGLGVHRALRDAVAAAGCCTAAGGWDAVAVAAAAAAGCCTGAGGCKLSATCQGGWPEGVGPLRGALPS